MSGQAAVLLPAGLTAEQFAEFKRLNAGVTTVRVLPGTEDQTPVTEIHPQAASLWIDILGGLVGAGAGILVPGGWLPFVQGALKVGITKVKELLAGEPYREKWTLAQITAEQAAVVDPQT